MLSTAESCTGGLVAAAITEVAGSSDWFDRGFVSYSNSAKQEMLQVSNELLECYGAVSEPVAKAMAIGALKHSLAKVSLAITGIAGPGGGSELKPIGTVWFAWAMNEKVVKTACPCFNGDRQSIREQATGYGLSSLLAILQNLP